MATTPEGHKLEVGDVVQIIEGIDDGRWLGMFAVVEEARSWDVRARIYAPDPDGDHAKGVYYPVNVPAFKCARIGRVAVAPRDIAGRVPQ